jgi:transposase InsO family protein
MERLIRRSPAEKMEIIRVVEQSPLPVGRVLEQLNVPRSSFYEWYRQYLKEGEDGLSPRQRERRQFWNRIPEQVQGQIVELALEHPDQSSREIAWLFTDRERYFVSESSVYRLLKRFDLVTTPAFEVVTAADVFGSPTKRVNELWQTDFTYIKIQGWGWYYLSTVLDDFSRYILAWKLTPTMAASDVLDTLELALKAAGLKHARVRHRPRLLSDNGPAYLSKELREYLEAQDIEHTRGAPFHPMTQGKIERYHRSMKNIVLLENYFMPEPLERAITAFVEHYNHHRYHESLNNLTPADVYSGRSKEILNRRAKIKRDTLAVRRFMAQQTRLAAGL